MLVEGWETTQQTRSANVFQIPASDFQRLDLGRHRLSVDVSAHMVVGLVSRDRCPNECSSILKALDLVSQIRVSCFVIHRKRTFKRYLNRKLC